MACYDTSFGGPSFDALSARMDAALAASKKRMDGLIADSEKRLEEARTDSEKRMNEARAASEKRMNEARAASEKRMNEAAGKINEAWDNLNDYSKALDNKWEEYTTEPMEELPPEIDMSKIKASPEDEDGTLVEVKLNTLPQEYITGPKEGENPQYDAIVKGNANPDDGREIVQMKTPEKAPVTGPKEGENPQYDAIVKAGTSKPNPLKDQPMISRQGISGKYIITESKNELGFDARSNFRFGMNHEANKFFGKASLIAMDKKDQITRGADGSYSFRGINAKTHRQFQQKLITISQKISGNNAIYNDLLSKQKSGIELTEPEQNFIKYHLQNLEKYGLGVDANGNLIDKMK